MLNNKSSFRQFMKGNGFYILTGVALIAVVTTAVLVPKKGEGKVAEQPERYATNRPAVAEDISDLRVPTIDPRMDEEDSKMVDNTTQESHASQEESAQQPPVAQVSEANQEEVVSETFSSTTSTGTDLFHPDNDLFAWPLENKIIYSYSDNETGRSFINPTLDRTMRSFGIFIEAEESSKVQAAAQGKVLAITDYPMAELSSKTDYPQVGTAIIVDHGNEWKTVYGLHEGQALVEVGDMVQTGDIIGSVGKASRDFSLTGTNLYFQILKNDVSVNPEEKLENSGNM